MTKQGEYVEEAKVTSRNLAIVESQGYYEEYEDIVSGKTRVIKI